MFSVAIDVHRNILSAQCRIRVEEESNIDVLQVVLSKTCLNITLMQNGVPQTNCHITSPSEFFIPTSVSRISEGTSLKIDENDVKITNHKPTTTSDGKRVFETLFRFQIPNTEALQRTESTTENEISALNKKFHDTQISSEEKNDQVTKPVEDFLRLLIKPKTLFQMNCTNCDLPVGESTFLKVKDHCDESASEGWFCHPTDSLTVSDHLPVNYLYLDETSFLFNKEFLKLDSCKCGSTLSVDGSQPKGFVRVYFDKIVFRSPEFPLSVNGKEYQKWISLLLLWKLIEKSRTSSLFSKIFLQSKSINSEADTCLYLLIPSERVSRFRLQKPLSSLPPNTPLHTETVSKVLFLTSTSTAKDFKKWKHDFQVDFYPVSDTMMAVVTEMLADSCGGEERSEDGFCFGYLPTCPDKI